jgi:vacuolar protein sorting-associated protein 11
MQKWKRFTFFRKELKKECTSALRHFDVTCGTGWGPKNVNEQTTDDPSFLMFGDASGSLHMVDCFGGGGIRSVKAFSIIVNSLYAADAVRVDNNNNSDNPDNTLRILLALGNAGDLRKTGDIEMAKKLKRAVDINNPDMTFADNVMDDMDPQQQVDDGLVCLKFFQVTSVEGLKCLKTIPIFLPEEDNSKARAVTFAAVKDLTLIAVGLSNGHIILYRGNIFGERMKKSTSASFKSSRNNYSKNYERIQIAVGSNGPSLSSPSSLPLHQNAQNVDQNDEDGKGITNLHFYNSSDISKNGNNAHNSVSSSTVLYVTTAQMIVSYANLNDPRMKLSNLRHTAILDSSLGAEQKCTSVTSNGLLSVARDDGIFLFDSDDKGACYSLRGPKALIKTFGKYSCLVTVERGLNRLSVYDLQSKFVGLTMTMRAGGNNPASVTGSGGDSTMSSDRRNLELAALLHSDGKVLDMFDTSGTLFVFTSTGRLYALDEKSIDEKLNDLYKKHMYNVALKIVANTPIDSRLIYKKFGDHLYSKGDYNQAVQQYIETIGYLDSSRVILKFLDAQCTSHLASYLEVYHRHPEAEVSTDHTTLLIDCFTKMHADEKLRNFIGYNATNLYRTKKPLTFDVQTAIVVLRDADYASEALFLAKKHGQHLAYIQIQLEVLENWEEALYYVKNISLSDAGTALKIYGKLLLNKLPRETTDMLKEMCTRKDENNKLHCEKFISLYVNHPFELKRFLWHVIKGPVDDSHIVGSSSKLVWNTLIELCLRQDLTNNNNTQNNPLDRTSSLKPSPSRKLLQSHAASSNNSLDEKEYKRVVDETMSLLRDPDAKYDGDHTLVCVQQARCHEALLYLYEKRKMFDMMMQHYMDTGNNRAVINTCRKVGNRNPNLWVKVLTHFASMESPECDPYIIQILQSISVSKILPPLLVVNILSKNTELPISIIQDYISDQLTQSIQIVSNVSKEIVRLKNDTKEIRSNISAQKTQGKVFQNNKCNLTEQSLEFPTVHFMSGYSYSVDNVPDNEGGLECPIKSPEHNRVWETEKALHKKANNHEDFFRELSHASKKEAKGFDVVGDFYGRDLFFSKKNDGGDKEVEKIHKSSFF